MLPATDAHPGGPRRRPEHGIGRACGSTKPCRPCRRRVGSVKAVGRQDPLLRVPILHRPTTSVALVLGVMIAAWVEAGLAPFTWPATATTAATALVVVAAATWRRRVQGGARPGGGGTERRERPSGALRAAGALAWAGAAAALVAWELAEYFRLPRSAHPTLSSLAQPYIGPGHHAARAAAFAVWAAAGWFLARR